jgi:hypothetical protein
MHIAILFFGRVQEYAKKYILNVLPPGHQYDFFLSSDNSPQDQIDGFIELYKPAAIINDTITYGVDFGKYPNGKTCPANIHNMTCHFINKKRVYGLMDAFAKENAIDYDLVIASRLDLFSEPIPLFPPAPNCIYIPAGEDHTGLNDRFAMGDMETMGKYMNIFDNCTYLLENGISVPHPENLTLYNILHHHITVIRPAIYQKIIY